MGIWEKEDKHHTSYEVLVAGTPKGDRAQQMGKLLGLTSVADEPSCLACHAVHITDAGLKSRSFRISDGVSCVVCHGPYESWIDEHGSAVQPKRERWRDLAREKKETEYGMADLWNPAKRTALCASCHVGNFQQGKFVTHQMYAAGHPPLPSFEAATFCNEMPRHWQYIKEKPPSVRAVLRFPPGSEKFEQTQLVLVSGLVVFREALNLLADQADDCTRGTSNSQRGLDLANFDCYACHHDLKAPSWRQQRRTGGKPGRPQMRAWPTALATLGLQLARNKQADARRFDDSLKELSAAFDSRPFGDCEKVGAAARRLVRWLDGTIDELLKSERLYDRDAAIRLLKGLCSAEDGRILDYDSARQVAWAFHRIYEELDPKPANDAEIQAVLRNLDADLKLKLPSRQDQEILGQLPGALQTISNYVPDRLNPPGFKQRLRQLANLLSNQPQVERPTEYMP
jgi:hypothetical protein